MNRPLLACVAAGVAVFVLLSPTTWGRSPPPSVPLPVAPPPPVGAGPSLATLAPGFELGTFPLPIPSRLGPGSVTFVRVDPAVVDLEVRAASLTDKRLRKASEWGHSPEKARAVAVINTSMFADDWLTSVGHLVVDGVAQNPRWAAQQNSLFVANPVGESGPRAAIVNLGCADRDAVVGAWKTQVQSIRMLGCGGENVWSQQARSWSSALVGADNQGRILFLHTRAPYTMHDLVDLLLATPLDLVALHYGEGGPEASLYVRGPNVELREVGSYETGFLENDNNALEWELPNVLVAVAW